ncbi:MULTISPECIES: DUF3667 domain-containing protein [Chitinophagaceae]
MSHHHKLREDHTCLNCGHQVEERYCTHCGQENVEPRQPFHYLFGHFVEDLTHYDHGFWETFKTLMVRPGKLIKNYLAGKRQSQVPPVKLYIFVSFLAFFLPAILPSHKPSKEEDKTVKKEESKTLQQTVDSLHNALNISFLAPNTKMELQHKIDSIVKIQTKNTVMENHEDEDSAAAVSIVKGDTIPIHGDDFINNNSFFRKIATVFNAKKAELKNEGYSNKEIKEKLTESFIHNLPKLLFFYLPLFAFFLWVFNSKKKWLYFDHGIFTLYYFSFLLTCITLIELIAWLGGFVHNGWMETIVGLSIAFLCIYPFIYFFLAQHRVYGGSRTISVVKGIVLFFINIIFMLVFLIGYFALIGYLLH